MSTSLFRLGLHYSHVLVTLFLLAVISPLQAAEPSTIQVDDRRVIDIAPKLQYWRTNRGTLSLEQVERAFHRGLFTQQQQSPLTLDRTRDGIWLRFVLQPEQETQEQVLAFRRPFYDHLSVYVPSNEGYQVHSIGYDHFSNKQAPKNWHYQIPITLHSNDSRPFYVYVEDSLTIRVALKVWHPDALAEQDTNMTVFLTVIFTTMLALALYNLSLFTFLKDKNYLYYAIYMVSLCLFLMTREATIYQIPWLSWPEWGVQQLIFMACLAAATAARFNQSFVNLAYYTPNLNRAIWLMIGLLGCIATLCLFNIRAFDAITASFHNWANFVLAPLMVVASIIAMRKGNRQARWFLAGWAFLLTATFIATLSALGLVDQSPVTLYGIHVAAALEAIILSAGLADRINIIRRERDKAEQMSREVDTRISDEKKRRHKSDTVTRYLASIHSRSSEQQVYSELVSTLADVMETPRCALLHSNTGSIRVYSRDHQLEEFFSREITGRIKLLEGVASQGEAMMLQQRDNALEPSSALQDAPALAVIPLYSWRREWSVILICPSSEQEFSHHQLRQANRFCETVKEQVLNYRRYRVTIEGSETDDSGALTRTALLKHAQRAMRQWNKHEEPLCIALWSLEECLVEQRPLDDKGQLLLLNTLVDCCRTLMQPSDILGRYGSHELLLLLPGHDQKSAQTMCRVIYKELREKLHEQYQDRFNLTLHVGVAAQSEPTDTLERLSRQLEPLDLSNDVQNSRLGSTPALP
ncbi:diguanylate cyclase [Aestuariirhabdus sp. Z084]|uniref:7TM diverse intracellular signaling domain-containing protein n=1 Tax=Aestuariirhabdus haliotis TaxID=2918751 RepID=UPI00201B36A4|nr:7TM diverse intracellular signaling domain-containing protein [Aestuariirhabdus haliotis]MCL6416458.1 diguanylate cyclase [Aestuariirhabdus haliotis]MCL6420448.1 diguanylate cyclase [Aestuariirhabdus haliotis]